MTLPGFQRFSYYLEYLTLVITLANTASAIDLQPIPLVDNVPGVSLGTIYVNETVNLRWTGYEGTVALILWATYPDRSGQIDLDTSNTKGFFDWTPTTNLITEADSYHVEVWDWNGGLQPAGKDLSGQFVVRAARASSVTKTVSTSSGSIPTLSQSTLLIAAIPTASRSEQPSASSSSQSFNGTPSGLSSGAKAGIGIGAGTIAIGLISLIILLLRRRKQSKSSAGKSEDKQTVQRKSEEKYVARETDSMGIDDESDYGGFRSKGELDASEGRTRVVEMEDHRKKIDRTLNPAELA